MSDKNSALARATGLATGLANQENAKLAMRRSIDPNARPLQTLYYIAGKSGLVGMKKPKAFENIVKQSSADMADAIVTYDGNKFNPAALLGGSLWLSCSDGNGGWKTGLVFTDNKEVETINWITQSFVDITPEGHDRVYMKNIRCVWPSDQTEGVWKTFGEAKIENVVYTLGDNSIPFEGNSCFAVGDTPLTMFDDILKNIKCTSSSYEKTLNVTWDLTCCRVGDCSFCHYEDDEEPFHHLETTIYNHVINCSLLSNVFEEKTLPSLISIYAYIDIKEDDIIPGGFPQWRHVEYAYIMDNEGRFAVAQCWKTIGDDWETYTQPGGCFSQPPFATSLFYHSASDIYQKFVHLYTGPPGKVDEAIAVCVRQFECLTPYIKDECMGSLNATITSRTPCFFITDAYNTEIMEENDPIKYLISNTGFFSEP